MRLIKNKILLIFLSMLCAAVSISAQNAQPSPPQPSNEDLQKRLTQMETEMKQMREELAKIKQATAAAQPSPQNTPNGVNVAKIESKAETKTETKSNQPIEASKQTKSLGVDIGSARLTPYGTIYFNAFGNSAGTNNADVPLFAAPTGNSNTSASVRQTRLGFRLEGARVGNANLKAILEADFFGGFPSVGIGENFGVVRLRLANARLDWEKTSVTIGQDWMVFAPVNPTSLAAAAIPQMAAAGNPWARIPQIKIERKLNGNFTLAGAILAPQTGDYPTASSFFLQTTSGASSNVPFFQSRIAYADANFFSTKKSGSVGLSAHYGRSKVFTGATQNIENDIDSLGVALDWNIPLAERLSLSGEAFFGRNLGGFQAGVFQSYNNDFAFRRGATMISGGVRSIGTRGGWTQFGFTPDAFQDRLSLYASIGIDDPTDEDLISRAARDFRRQNFSFAFDAIYKFSLQLLIGAEFRRLQTLYLLSGRRNANHINLSAAFSF